MAFAISGTTSRWPDGVMPFEISDEFNSDQRNVILRAIAHWNEHTIMRLIPREDFINPNSVLDYVVFHVADDSCSSSVGRVTGAQTIGCDIGDGFGVGSIIHEIGHAAGFYHEQQRPDRDLFITVNEENIEEGKEHNFEIRTTGVLLGPYDYGSIMHYPRNAFADGGDTITPLNGASIGQREGLSELDIKGVCSLYDAPHFSIAWQDDNDENGQSNIFWSGLTRWGKHCHGPIVVHSNTRRDQASPAIAVDNERNNVIVWQDNRNGDYQIRARRIGVTDNDRINNLVVNTENMGSHEAPSIAAIDNGDFIVAWQTRQGNNQQIRARGFNRSGNELFPEIIVSSGERGIPAVPAICLADRNFIVVWGELTNDSLSVHAKGFDPTGNTRFPAITVAENLGDQDVWPRVAATTDGNFIVVWEDRVRDVKARGFNSDGSERFPEFMVAGDTAGRQILADVCISSNQEIIIVWTDDRNENNLGQIRARVFDLNGGEVRRDFTINQRGGGDQRKPRIAANAAGEYFVVWEDDRDRNGKYQVHVQGRDASHEHQFGPYTVNKIWLGQQVNPVISSR